jgi:hypothetical protein
MIFMKQHPTVTEIPDEELHGRLRRLVGDERHYLADILAHMAEVDRRKSHLAAGYGSIFDYVTGYLGYDADAGKQRIGAARLLNRYPAIGPLVAGGALHLSGLRLLGPRLTDENHADLLAAAAHKSKRQIAELLATLFPTAPVPTSTGDGPGPAAAPAAEPGDGPGAPPSTPPAGAPPPPSAPGTTPLSADCLSITFTISRACHDKLVEARALLRHAIPSGDVGAIVERALDGLLAQTLARRVAATGAPRANRADAPAPRAGSRHIPAAVKRAVVDRDGLRCAFVSAAGKRCDQRAWLEFHHVHPYGKGGPATEENIRIYCRQHNNYAAERDYGTENMRRARAGDPDPPGRSVTPPAAAPPPAPPPATIPATLLGDALSALRNSGYKREEAQRAVRAAVSKLPAACSLQDLVLESFRCANKPSVGQVPRGT